MTHSASTPDRRRQAPLPWLTWWFSSIFAIALVALIVTVIVQRGDASSTYQVTVSDAVTGQAIPNAEIRSGDDVWVADDQGRVTLPESVRASEVSIRVAGYQTYRSETGLGSAVALQPNPADVAQLAIQPTTVPGETATAGSTPSTDSPIVAEATAVSATPEAASRTIEGVISDPGGTGLQGARIVAGGKVDVTGKDGRFSLALDAELPATATVIRYGYLEQEVALGDGRAPLSVAMEPHKIKAIYLNPNITETEEDVDRLIDMINTTELNAVVIDIKEELIFYESQVPFFVDNDVVVPKYDIDAMLAKFQEHDIYTIARLVVFKDSLIAENNPDLAVLNNQTGDLWRDMNGVAWVNPMVHDLWEANTDLAREAAGHGFDEIQFDYVRFPTDGDLSTMDFGLENTQDVRQRSIEKFLQMAQEKVHPTGAKLSADVFGYTMLVEDDLGIGQNFARLAEYVDYLSPMIYPSHFPEGSIAVDGHPNDFPYETIEISLRLGREKLGGDAFKMRPWLQDFSFFDLMPYGDAEVRAQIDASNDIGTSGWLLWDPNNQYHPGALLPEGGDGSAGPDVPRDAVATPAATPTTRRRSRQRR